MTKANLQSKHQNNFEAKFQSLDCEHALQNVSHTKNSKDYKIIQQYYTCFWTIIQAQGNLMGTKIC